MRDYVPDCYFPTNNQYGIPTLDLNFCAQYVDAPVIAWGTTRRGDKMPGTWHFYVDDYRFNALWQHPERVVETNCRSCVEPNFSIYQQTPPALSIWQVFRKRWIARYWQSKGILVFADMNVNREYQHINTAGIPEGWTAFATRGYTDRWKDVLRERTLAGEIAGPNAAKVVFVVYGGGKVIKQLCGDNGLVWIPEQEDEK